MAIVFPLKFPNIFGSSPNAVKDNSQAEKREGGSKCEGEGLMTGFPFVHHGADRYKPTDSLTIPRMKYTWFVEFQINQAYLESDRLSTNLDHFLENDNRIYLNLKAIDHPKPNIPTETLRSYNKYIKVPTRFEYPPAQMTFDDDATSIIMALWKEYFAFYSHAGDIGFQMLLGTDLVSSTREDVFIAIDQNIATHGYGHLVSSGGTEPRASMDIRPSLGMRLKPNTFRHFFDNIIVYDLGMEPDSVNVYYFHRPVFTSFDHGGLDWEDRTGKVEINATFEYENYYFALGKQRWTVRDVIKRMTGQDVPISTDQYKVESSHGDMREPQFPEIPQGTVDPPNPILQTIEEGSADLQPEPIEEPRNTTDIQEDINKVNRSQQRLISKCSSARDDAECLKQQREYDERITDLESELNGSRQFENEKTKESRQDESTQDALDNTKNNSGASDTTPSTKSAVRTSAQTQKLEAQLQVATSSTTKLENSVMTQERTLFFQKEALKASDTADLEIEGSGRTQLHRQQYRTIQNQIKEGEIQLALTKMDLRIATEREQKLKNVLDK